MTTIRDYAQNDIHRWLSDSRSGCLDLWNPTHQEKLRAIALAIEDRADRARICCDELKALQHALVIRSLYEEALGVAQGDHGTDGFRAVRKAWTDFLLADYQHCCIFAASKAMKIHDDYMELLEARI
jgi:hypothetical protein